jgi:tRNA threonylcarbamoyladenosine biosynthesis protein TsaE
MQQNVQKIILSDEKSLDKYTFPLIAWDRVFFYGDLGAGKSTFIRHLLRKHFDNPSLVVRSPTYTYYQKYLPHPLAPSPQREGERANPISLDVSLPSPHGRRAGDEVVYHFDLYRIEDIATFYSIWWMEILENPDTIALIEWPELIEDFITPTKKVSIQILENGEREIVIGN